MRNDPPSVERLLSENINVKHVIFYLIITHRRPRDTENIQVLAIASGCPQYLGGNAVLLKIPQTLIVGNLSLMKKLS